MSNNLLSILIGLMMIVSCSTIFFIAQKKLFRKNRKRPTEASKQDNS
ncbi:hypothetical protein SAMN05421736_101227 [Evansella caseinilytica]|uniref:Uncharacterized protein n=1 Tax=Evansella caseinilytica TaxID=1503961 RepID=A0A1H3GN57_9BACI|nr:hypothetical protein [Evansella caseinilytica]SDY04753.1 hypothetical protein SAMN05421736_101227 [Evansella caseinilytica]